MSEGLTGAAGCGLAPVSYDFYLDGYGGALAAEEFAEALPAAVRCVGALTGSHKPGEGWDDELAADAFAEYGEGRVGGFSIGSFSVTNYRDEGTTGSEVARTGLAFAGVR